MDQPAVDRRPPAFLDELRFQSREGQGLRGPAEIIQRLPFAGETIAAPAIPTLVDSCETCFHRRTPLRPGVAGSQHSIARWTDSRTYFQRRGHVQLENGEAEAAGTATRSSETMKSVRSIRSTITRGLPRVLRLAPRASRPSYSELPQFTIGSTLLPRGLLFAMLISPTCTPFRVRA